MRFDELLTEVEMDALASRLRWIVPFSDALNAIGGERRGSLRRAIARRMIRVGAWLDGEAVERFAMVRRTR